MICIWLFVYILFSVKNLFNWICNLNISILIIAVSNYIYGNYFKIQKSVRNFEMLSPGELPTRSHSEMKYLKFHDKNC